MASFKLSVSQSVQLLSHVRLFATTWIAARQASPSITNSRSLLKLMSIESVMPSSHLILCHPLLLLPPNPPSIRVFSNESTLHMRWQKYWSFSFSISPCNEHPGLISFRMDWLDLLAAQGTLKSLLQHHSSKASVLRRSVFFTVQLSTPFNPHPLHSQLEYNGLHKMYTWLCKSFIHSSFGILYRSGSVLSVREIRANSRHSFTQKAFKVF